MEHTKRLFTIDRKDIKVTEKTQDHLMSAKWEDLNLVEKALRSDLERHPDMSWEKAIEMSEMSPL
jgi:hypothetical protein